PGRRRAQGGHPRRVRRPPLRGGGGADRGAAPGGGAVRRLAPLAALSALCALPLPGCAEDAPAAWVAVRRGDLVIGAEVTGALRAVDSTPIKPPPIRDKWDFKIAQMADEGITVKQGDVVVAFDGFEMMQLLEQLENDADAVEAELDKRVADAAMARKDE